MINKKIMEIKERAVTKFYYDGSVEGTFTP